MARLGGVPERLGSQTRKGADHARCDRWRDSGARDGGASGSSRPGPRARAGQEDRVLDSLGAESRVHKWYETKGKEFREEERLRGRGGDHPLPGLRGQVPGRPRRQVGAPDFFNGIVHQWCGQYDFCDKMPADLEKTWSENLPKYMLAVGQFKGRHTASRSSTATSSRCTSTWSSSRRPGSIPTSPRRRSTSGWPP